MHIAPLGHLRPDPVHLVPEHQTYGKRRSPVKQIHCVRSSFNRRNLGALRMKAVEQWDRVPGMFPSHRFFGAQRGLANPGCGWCSGDAGEQEHLQRHGVGGAKKRTHIVGGADVVEQHRNGQSWNGIVERGYLGGSEREAVGQDVRLASPENVLWNPARLEGLSACRVVLRRQVEGGAADYLEPDIVSASMSTIPARPASELKLTKAEIALLDPDWITEVEADVIHCKRAEASEEAIPLEKVLSEIGERNRRKLVGSKTTLRRSG
jgi:hypothetical protein